MMVKYNVDASCSLLETKTTPRATHIFWSAAAETGQARPPARRARESAIARERLSQQGVGSGLRVAPQMWA
eukprot:4834406-Heterocapsa_arctica.AAC.1